MGGLAWWPGPMGTLGWWGTTAQLGRRAIPLNGLPPPVARQTPQLRPSQPSRPLEERRCRLCALFGARHHDRELWGLRHHAQQCGPGEYEAACHEVVHAGLSHIQTMAPSPAEKKCLSARWRIVSEVGWLDALSTQSWDDRLAHSAWLRVWVPL